jgi:hypothetical protein
MAARPLVALVLALAVTLAWAPAAGAARNGPIGWAHLERRGPVIVESDSAGGAIRDLLGPSVHAGAGVFSPTGDRYAYQGIGRDVVDRVFVAHLLGSGVGTRGSCSATAGTAGSGSATGRLTGRRSSTTSRTTSAGARTSRPSTA